MVYSFSSFVSSRLAIMLNISKVAYSKLESLTPSPLPPPGDKRPGDF